MKIKNSYTLLFRRVAIVLLVLQSVGQATPKKKFQEITFNEMDVQGSARLPDGTYLVQRRGLRFLPLYEVKKDLDEKIRKSTTYLK